MLDSAGTCLNSLENCYNAPPYILLSISGQRISADSPNIILRALGCWT
jgi:hypothetical protein